MLMLQLKLLLLRNLYTARSCSAQAPTAVQTLVTSCSGRGIGVPELEMRIGAASRAIEKVKVGALSLYLQPDGRNHCWNFFSYVKSSSMQRVWTLQNKKYSQAEDLQKCFICHELGPKFHISLPSFDIVHVTMRGLVDTVKESIQMTSAIPGSILETFSGCWSFSMTVTGRLGVNRLEYCYLTAHS